MVPSAQGFLWSLAAVACSIGAVDRSSWLRTPQEYLSWVFIRGRDIVFRRFCQSMHESAGEKNRDDAVAPFE